MGEFSDMTCKPCSNFKSIGWRLTILEIWPMLTFWPQKKTLIGGWIQWRDMQILFKFKVNRMKIEDFRNVGLCWPSGLCWPQNEEVIDFIDLICKWSSNFKSIRWKLRILENLCNLAQICLLANVDLKINRWLNSLTWYAKVLQISSQSDENWQFYKQF